MTEATKKPLSDAEKDMWDSLVDASIRQGNSPDVAAKTASDVIKARREAFEGNL